MLRWLTAGESRGRVLLAVPEGVPAGVEIGTADIAAALPAPGPGATFAAT
jgi:chorismate synthase